MGQLLKIRYPDGRVMTPADWTTAEGLYSTVEFGVGAFTTLDAFSYGLNQAVPGSAQRNANYADTNLQGQGGALPENEAMLIRAIRIEFYGINVGTPAAAPLMTSADNEIFPDVGLRNMMRIMNSLILSFTIAQVKEYLRVPVSWFAAGSGAESGTAGGVGFNGTAGYIVGNNGSTSVKGIRQLASPLFIQGGETFRGRFIAPTGAIDAPSAMAFTGSAAADARIRLRIHLLGDHKRPVA